jgi:hypothetical protein
VILATDTWQTIRVAVDRWQAQTARKNIELVLVAPSANAVSEASVLRNQFATIRIVEDPVTDLAAARAAGIRAASSELVFVAETHCFPSPEFTEVVLATLTSPWSSVAPGFGNGNPKGILSWAGFISDYAQWVEGLPPGEIPEAPLYNAVYRREVLMELDDRLVPCLSHGDELWLTLRARGHRVYFQPNALLNHFNVSRPTDWVKERFIAGLLIASHRARRWTLWRRLAYVAGSFLIPIVLTWRIMPGFWKVTTQQRLSLLTIPAIILGMIIKSSGEMIGYAGCPVNKAERGMHEYEVHKLNYIVR